MISKELYDKIKVKYGDVASWAVWEEPGIKPKSNMGYHNIFDLNKNPSLLKTLKTTVVMVGLNFSRPLEPTEPFKNFHDLNPHANDFKIRYAFLNTDFYGAYMTDVIKKLEMKISRDVKTYVKDNPSVIKDNILLFQNELSDIEVNRPIILAFGRDAYNILHENLSINEYSILIKLTHYSHQISKEKYKDEVLRQINDVMNEAQRKAVDDSYTDKDGNWVMDDSDMELKPMSDEQYAKEIAEIDKEEARRAALKEGGAGSGNFGSPST